MMCNLFIMNSRACSPPAKKKFWIASPLCGPLDTLQKTLHWDDVKNIKIAFLGSRKVLQIINHSWFEYPWQVSTLWHLRYPVNSFTGVSFVMQHWIFSSITAFGKWQQGWQFTALYPAVRIHLPCVSQTTAPQGLLKIIMGNKITAIVG